MKRKLVFGVNLITVCGSDVSNVKLVKNQGTKWMSKHATGKAHSPLLCISEIRDCLSMQKSSTITSNFQASVFYVEHQKRQYAKWKSIEEISKCRM